MWCASYTKHYELTVTIETITATAAVRENLSTLSVQSAALLSPCKESVKIRNG